MLPTLIHFVPQYSLTTAFLEGHSDEVWNLEWCHDGKRLATASKDRTTIIWRLHDSGAFTQEHVLTGHANPIGCASWSIDDAFLATSADSVIKVWDTRLGNCVRTLEAHKDAVTRVLWSPDGSGLISAGLDRLVIFWDLNGGVRVSWPNLPIRVSDMTVTQDVSRVIVAGFIPVSANDLSRRVRVFSYDLLTKQPDLLLEFSERDAPHLCASRDSRYLLVNCSPDPSDHTESAEILLLELNTAQIVQRYTGHEQSRLVIRSCFVGPEERYIASGSEDGAVYIWSRESGALLERLEGHGTHPVNAVAWNPMTKGTFASCSDDGTVRVWELDATTTA